MSVPGSFRPGREDRAAAAASTTVEPCVGCHEETAAGSAFYSDRLEIPRADGGRAYLCTDCHARATAARNGKPLADADLQTIGDNGVFIGLGLIGI
jgi:hypothetical protein